MKSLHFILLLLIFQLPYHLLAQFDLGFQAGVGTSTHWGSDRPPVGFTPALGFHGQFSVGYWLNQNCSFRTGTSVDQIRFDQDVELVNVLGVSEAIVRLGRNSTYLTLPLLFRFSWDNEEKKIVYMVQGGPYARFFLRGRQTAQLVNGNTNANFFGEDVRISSDRSIDDVGFRMALGLGIPITNQLQAELWLQHDRSLQNQGSSILNTQYRLSTYQLVLGMHYTGLGGK